VSGRTVRWLLSLLPRGAARGAHLTIVRHHRVYAAGERPLLRLGVSETVLADQLALLRSMNLAPLTVGEGMARLAAGKPGRWVAFSFDDGYADNVTRALPLLHRFGARATFYLTAGLIEERKAAWWDELAHALEAATVPACEVKAADGSSRRFDLATAPGRAGALRAMVPQLRLEPAARRAALERLRTATGAAGDPRCEFATWPQAARLADAGMEIGAHTLTHPHLSLLDPGAQRAEIAGSADLIARRLGVRPAGFAYPGGDFDESALGVVREYRFAHAVTTRAGDVTPDADPHQLKRRGLSEGACLGPGGRFSRRLALAELGGAFDRLRGVEGAAA
jgi:peptidoglycan/xylan/chitin deacetylase (PgdA/CDA1 family)